MAKLQKSAFGLDPLDNCRALKKTGIRNIKLRLTLLLFRLVFKRAINLFFKNINIAFVSGQKRKLLVCCFKEMRINTQ